MNNIFTVFENHIKSLIQHWSELRLHLDWTEVQVVMVNYGEFLKAWSSRSTSVTRQVSFNGKLVENGKFQKINCDILNTFQTLIGGERRRSVKGKEDLEMQNVIWITCACDAMLHNQRVTYIQNNITTCFSPRFSFFKGTLMWNA